jgi:hypothetical protein
MRSNAGVRACSCRRDGQLVPADAQPPADIDPQDLAAAIERTPNRYVSVPLAGYHSPSYTVGARGPHLSGPAIPELDGITNEVRDWLNAGVEPHAIGIATRTSGRASTIRAALRDAGLPDDLRVTTMHKMKGMEFRCVAVAGVSVSSIPEPAAVTAVNDDPIAHDQDIHRERCLLFVACTRARDTLTISYSGPPSPFLS